MKKKITSILCCLAITVTFAGVETKTLNTPTELRKEVYKTQLFPSLNSNLNSNLSSATSKSRWYGYHNFARYYAGSVNNAQSKLNSTLIFPDSIIRVQYTDGLAPASFSGFADILDPKAWLFNDVQLVTDSVIAITKGLPYTVDSVTFPFLYHRVSNSKIVDTLIVKVNVNANYFNAITGYGGKIAENFNDTVIWFVNIPYSKNGIGTSYIDTTSASPKGKVITIGGTTKTYKILLDSAFYASYDTSSAGNTTNSVVAFAKIKCAGLSGSIGSSLVMSSIAFKPGYSYTVSDTLTSNNNVRLYSYEENGQDTYQTFFYNKDFGAEYNVSYVAPMSVNYNQQYNYNGRYLPSYLYSEKFGYEHHYINYKLSCATCGTTSIDENEKANSLSVFPNPTTGDLNIKLENNTNAIAKLVNINGQVVYSENVSNKTFAKVDMSNFAKGIYTLQIVSDKGVETKKIVKE